MKTLKSIFLFIAIFTILFSCSIHRNTVSNNNSVQIPDSLVNWVDSLVINALDSIRDSIIFYGVRDFRGKLTSKLKKSGNAAMAIALIDELEKKEYFAHSRIDTFTGNLYEKIPFISLKPNPEIYPWFCVDNNAGVSIPRNGDTEYKIVSDITKRLNEKTDIDGDVVIFTELPPCNSCSHAIYMFSKHFPHLRVEVLYSPYGRLIPLKNN